MNFLRSLNPKTNFTLRKLYYRFSSSTVNSASNSVDKFNDQQHSLITRTKCHVHCIAHLLLLHAIFLFSLCRSVSLSMHLISISKLIMHRKTFNLVFRANGLHLHLKTQNENLFSIEHGKRSAFKRSISIYFIARNNCIKTA